MDSKKTMSFGIEAYSINLSASFEHFVVHSSTGFKDPPENDNEYYQAYDDGQ